MVLSRMITEMPPELHNKYRKMCKRMGVTQKAMTVTMIEAQLLNAEERPSGFPRPLLRKTKKAS